MTYGILLVTGANGFIGRHLVRSMLEAGSEVVVGLRRPATHEEPLAGLPWIDLRVDQPQLRWALKEQASPAVCIWRPDWWPSTTRETSATWWPPTSV